ncbi:MAG TPA: hypothetical protein VFW62_09095, partial [bacterium]|nr:hypothetical protein [bacterium]
PLVLVAILADIAEEPIGPRLAEHNLHRGFDLISLHDRVELRFQNPLTFFQTPWQGELSCFQQLGKRILVEEKQSFEGLNQRLRRNLLVPLLQLSEALDALALPLGSLSVVAKSQEKTGIDLNDRLAIAVGMRRDQRQDIVFKELEELGIFFEQGPELLKIILSREVGLGLEAVSGHQIAAEVRPQRLGGMAEQLEQGISSLIHVSDGQDCGDLSIQDPFVDGFVGDALAWNRKSKAAPQKGRWQRPIEIFDYLFLE